MAGKKGMRSRESQKMNAAEVQAAVMISEGQSIDHAAIACKIPRATLYRRMKDQLWLDYMVKLRSKHEANIEKQAEVARGKIKFGYEEAAAFYLNMMNTAVNEFCKLKAADSLVDLMGIKKGQATDPEGQPEKAKFYRSEWMDEKPN